MNFYAQLGTRIRQIRELRGLSQAALGEKIHRVQPVIYQWEKGKTRLMVEDLWLLAQALKVPIAAFFDEGRSGDIGGSQSDYPINWDLQVAASYLSAAAQHDLVTLLISIRKKQGLIDLCLSDCAHETESSSAEYLSAPVPPDPEYRMD